MDYLKLEVPILTEILDIEEEDIKKYIRRIYEIGDIMSKSTNVKASMSDYQLHKREKIFHPLLDKVIDKIKNNFDLDILQNLEVNPKDTFNYQLIESWSAIYKHGDFAIKHNHSLCYISFCLYLQVDEFSSPLFFNDLNFHIKPQKNMLIVFPSFLNHSVEKQEKKGKDRIVIAGNIFLFNK